MYAGEELGIDLTDSVYALDSTTIDLCMSVFPWAHFRSTKSAVKMHTLLDLRGNIPSFIHVSNGKLHLTGAFFVTRAKSNMDSSRLYSAASDRSNGIICDQSIRLDGFRSSESYPEHLRRIRFNDPNTEKKLTFLTNHHLLPAPIICALYKSRWQIELFFKWIKQHLRIKAFYGTSENAVKTQIWIAVAVYVLVAIVRKRLGIEAPLYTFLQVLSLTLFEKMPILQAFSSLPNQPSDVGFGNQLNLFGY